MSRTTDNFKKGFKEWKTQRAENSTDFSDFENYAKARREAYNRRQSAIETQSALNNIGSRIDSLLGSYNTNVESYNKRYSGSAGYKADYSKWRDSMNTAYDDYAKEYDSLIKELEKYKSYYSDEDYKAITDSLASGRLGLSQMTVGAKKEFDFYDSFADEQDYKNWEIGWGSEDAKLDAKAISGRQERYQANIEQISEYDAKISQLKSGIETLERDKGMGWKDKVLEKERQIAAYTENRIALENENRLYDKRQSYIDSTYTKDDFEKVSQLRDFENPTAEVYRDYKTITDNGISYVYDPNTGTNKAVDINGDPYDFNIQSPVENDKLGIYLSATDEERAEAASLESDMETGYDAILADGEHNSWYELTEQEISVYYYLLNTEGKEKAYEYLDGMTAILNKRSSDRYNQKLNKTMENANAFEKIALSAATVPANVFLGGAGFIEDAVNLVSGKEINPYSPAHSVSNFVQNVRSNRSEDWKEATNGVSILGFDAGQLYQSFMSGADSLVGGFAMGGDKYGLSMGMNAASSRAKELYEKGASTEQILTGSLVSGIIEGATEKMGIDNFFNKVWGKGKTAITGFLEGLIKQGAAEASEEAVAEFANIIADSIIMAERSDFQESYRQKLIDGKSKGAALAAIISDNAISIINAAQGGFASGGAMGGFGGFVSGAAYDGAIKQHGKAIMQNPNAPAALVKLAEELNADGDNKALSKALAKMQKSANARNTGRLSVELQDAIEGGNRVSIAKVLSANGLTAEDSIKGADAILAALENEDFSISDAAESFGKKYGEIVPVLEKVLTDIKENPDGELTSVTGKQKQLKLARMGFESEKQMISSFSRKMSVAALSPKMNKDGKTTDAEGNEVSINMDDLFSRQEDENGSITVYVSTDKGKVNIDDIRYGNTDEGLIIETLCDLNPVVANSIAKNFNSENYPNVMDYLNGMREGILYFGRYNITPTENNVDFLDELTDTDHAIALQMGKDFAATLTREESRKAKTNAAKGKVSFETTTDEKGNKKTARAKSSIQRAAVEFAKVLSEAMKIDIHFFDSQLGQRADENGHYSASKNEIWVDLSAKGIDGRNIAAWTLGHEITHAIQAWSLEKYKILGDFLIEQYGGDTADALIKAQMSEFGYDEGKAYDEVVAEACSEMLLDSDISEKLVELANKDKSLVQKLRQLLKNILSRIRTYMQKNKTYSPEVAELRKIEGAYEKVLTLFEDALLDTAEKSRSATDTNVGDKDVEQQSKKRIIGVSGKDYGEGVYLDNTILDNLTDAERKKMVKLFFNEELAGNTFIAYDGKTPVAISLARSNEKFKNEKGNKVKVNEDITKKFIGDKIKQEAVVLADELIEVSKKGIVEKANHAHDWVDNNGQNNWYVRTVILQDKNNAVYEAKLKIANSTDGRKILYDIVGIKEKEAGPAGNSASITPLGNSISDSAPVVNTSGENNSADEISYSKKRNTFSAKAAEIQKDFVSEIPVKSEARAEVISDFVELEKLYREEYAGIADSALFAEHRAAIEDALNHAAEEITYAVLSREAFKNNPDLEIYADIRKHFRGMTIAVSIETKKSMDANANRYNDIRKKLWGYGIKLIVEDTVDGKREAMGVDTAFMEAAEIFGEGFFDTDKVTAVEDMLEVILDVVSTKSATEKYLSSLLEAQGDSMEADIKTQIRNRFEAAAVATLGANQSTARGILVSALERTADGAETELLTQYKENIGELYDLQARSTELGAQIRELSFAKGKRDTARIAQLRNEKQKIDARISRADSKLLKLEATKPLSDLIDRETKRVKKAAEEKGRQMRREAITEKNESFAVRKARASLTRLVSDTVDWILKPKKGQVKVPDMLKEPYAEFLESINLASKQLQTGTGTATRADLNIANKLKNLAIAVEKAQGFGDNGTALAGYLDIPEDFADALLDTATEIEKLMRGGGNVLTMTSSQIRELSQQIRTINHAIKHMATMYQNGLFANAKDAAESTMEYVGERGERQRGETKVGKAKDYIFDSFEWDMADPIRAFDRFGEGGKSIFKELMQAQAQLAFNVQKIFDFKEANWSDKEVRAWEKEKVKFTTERGEEISVPISHIMSLYCTQMRENANRGTDRETNHLYGADTTIIVGGRETVVRLSENDVNGLVSKLSKKQLEVAQKMQEFMSTICAQWGNEVSMRRFLIEQFTEKFYFPFETTEDSRDATSAEKQKSEANLYRLLNISATKPLTKGANNGLNIRSIFEVFANHTSDMAKLNSFGIPLLDLLKWYNYTENFDGHIEGTRPALRKAFGAGATNYVMELVKDLNGRPAQNAGITGIIFRNAKAAAVGANLRVAFLQFTSYFRASVQIKSRYLTTAFAKRVLNKGLRDRMLKYSGIALWKSFGYYDINIGRNVESQIRGNESGREKIIETFGKLAGKADDLTWGILWQSCESQVAAETNLKVGTDEFYKKVAEVFDDMIYRTQVVDSILTRTQAMRNKNAFKQTAWAFMSEPAKTYNMYFGAAEEAIVAAKSKDKARQLRAAKVFTKTVVAMAITHAFASAIEAAFSAFRDEDDEEFGEKWWVEFRKSLIENVNPLNSVAILGDVSQALVAFANEKWWGDQEWIPDYYGSSSLTSQVLDSIDGIKDAKTAYATIYEAMKALSYGSGIAGANILRDVVSAWNTVMQATGNEDMKIRKYPNSEAERKGMYKDILAGDKEAIEGYQTEYGDDYTSTVRTALKENDERIMEAAIAYYEEDFDKYDEILSEIEAEGKFSKNDIRGAVKSAYGDYQKSLGLERSSSATPKTGEVSYFSPADIITAHENRDTENVKMIFEDLVELEMGKDEYKDLNDRWKRTKAEKAVKSNIASQYRKLYKKAYENKDEAEKNRIISEMKALGYWVNVKDFQFKWNKAFKEEFGY